jgi:hypothetical protein
MTWEQMRRELLELIKAQQAFGEDALQTVFHRL